MAVKLNPRPRASLEASTCQHCGSNRVVVRLSELVGFQRRHPSPEMVEPIAQLVAWYPAQKLIAVCPGCGCLTANLGAHYDHSTPRPGR